MIAWVEGADTEIAIEQCWRLSQRALAYLIWQASGTRKNTINLVWKYIEYYKAASKNQILSNVLRSLHELAQSIDHVTKILCSIFERESQITVELADPFLSALVQSLKQVW